MPEDVELRDVKECFGGFHLQPPGYYPGPLRVPQKGIIGSLLGFRVLAPAAVRWLEIGWR